MNKYVTVKYHSNGVNTQVPNEVKLVIGKNIVLNKISAEGKCFLGWSTEKDATVGFMNFVPKSDTVLYAVWAEGAAYTLNTYFRGDPENNTGKRCQFRRYVLDINLENAHADNGILKINCDSGLLYYLGNVPVEDINVQIDSPIGNLTENGVENFVSREITVKWSSEKVLDGTVSGVKIASIMLYFAKWGMGYADLMTKTSDELISVCSDFNAEADGKSALVSANFYGGIVPEILIDDTASTQIGPASKDEQVLSRFAVLADSHVGVRYNWENYDWLYGVYDHISRIHSENPLDFVLQLGDNIDDGYAKSYKTDYDTYLETIKRLRICDPVNPVENREDGKIPNYEMQGNHDTSMETRFFRQKLWYTQNNGGEKVAHIAFFTNYGGYPLVSFRVCGDYASYRSYGKLTVETVQFVESSIIAAKKNGAKHIVLLNHFGIAQTLGAPILPETGLGKIEQLCKKYNIKLYFNGHEHNSDYTLRQYNGIYNYDAAMTKDRYAIVEITESYARVQIYNTQDNSFAREDIIPL